jgi:hypothetical protein
VAYLPPIDDVDEMLSENLTHPRQSQWASNIALIKRKSVLGEPSRKRITADMQHVKQQLKRLQILMHDA